MTQCKTCGAKLPDTALYCLQCGTPVTPPDPTQPGSQPKLDFLQPALAGGMALGLLSSIPIIGLGNCLCCMWVVGGGALSSYLLLKQNPAGIRYGDGAFGGVLSGLVGAVVATLMSIPVRLLTAGALASQQQAFDDMIRQTEITGPLRDLFLRIASPEISVVTV